MFVLILMLLGLISLACAALNLNPPHPRVNFGWLGMFLWLLALVLGLGPLSLR